MADLKGYEKLNEEIGKLLADYGVTSVSINCATDGFEYHPLDNSICISIINPYACLGYMWFVEFCEKRFNYKTDNVFMLLLFHEIGHIHTYNETLNNYFEPKRKKLYERMAIEYDTDSQSKGVFFEYFESVEEIIATTWAIDYLTKNEEEVKNLFYEICSLLNDFYELNGITEE